VPPMPVPAPTMPPPSQARPPPPPPPGHPPSRQSTFDGRAQQPSGDDTQEETEYEGDYDTDIAPGATHKDALKSHTRDVSLDESTTADEAPPKPPGPPPSEPPALPPPGARRSMPPPPPPSQPPRTSVETGRPPVPRTNSAAADEDDYDPYRYNSTPRTLPPPVPSGRPTHAAPPPPSVAPPLPSRDEIDREDEGSEEDLYSEPPPRKSADRLPPPLPQAPPPERHHAPPPPPPMSPPMPGMHHPPPPPPSQAAPMPSHPAPPPVPPSEPPQAQPSRKSLDVNRNTAHHGRKSMDQPRPSTDTGFIANDVDLGYGSQWWTQPNIPPPVFQNRKDVLFETEESTSNKRGGKTMVSKDVYILFQDYSQTIINVQFDARNPSDASLEQRHEAPPQRLRQDQLEDAHSRFGARIAEDVNSKQNTVVGDGTPHALIYELLRPCVGALPPVGTRSYGALVYANLANATVQQFDEIRPGDIISFRNAKFQGKHGAMHAKYSMDVGKPDHVAVVIEWDGTKKKVRAYEQGREGKKVKSESFRVADLRSGEVRVWRVMGRGWVGWEGE
jgi:myosin tail region-interacting protein MTI1